MRPPCPFPGTLSATIATGQPELAQLCGLLKSNSIRATGRGPSDQHAAEAAPGLCVLELSR